MKKVIVSGSLSKDPPGQAVGVVDLEQMEVAAAAALPFNIGRGRPRSRPHDRSLGRGQGGEDDVGDSLTLSRPWVKKLWKIKRIAISKLVLGILIMCKRISMYLCMDLSICIVLVLRKLLLHRWG